MTDPNRTESVTQGEADSRTASLVLFPGETNFLDRLAIVIVTRNRLPSLLRTLRHLESLEHRYSIVVVDNASEDYTIKMVRRQFPDVKLVALDHNYGAVARNFGVEIADQPYVAFCDDDSWWAPGSLSQAIELFERYPKLGLIMSKILVGPGGRYDPCCRSMEDSPLPNPLNLPGFPVLGFIACGAIVRRSAFRAAGGFNPNFGTWGEEELLAIDMAKNGWGLSYIPDIVSHHHPSNAGENKGRKIQEVRNDLWTYWIRRSPSAVFHQTGKYLKDGLSDREVIHALLRALKGMGWVIRKRDPVPGWLEYQLQLKETNRGNC